MSDSVYVLARGSYSDYRVMCVCPNKREADELAARYNATSADHYGDTASVEELPTADSSVQRVEVLRMQVNLWDDGTETEERIGYRVEWPFDLLYEDDAKPVHWRWVRAPIHNGRGGRLEVSGTDHERVRKVFSDRRALIKYDDAFRAKREARGSR